MITADRDNSGFKLTTIRIFLGLEYFGADKNSDSMD